MRFSASTRNSGLVRRPTRREALRTLGLATALATGTLAFGPAALAQDRPLYKDARAPIPARVEDLLKRMTLDEKVAQIITLWATKRDIMDELTFNPAKASTAYPNGFGQIARPSDRRGATPGGIGPEGGTGARWRTPRATVEFVNAVQRWAIEKTRLGIPVLFHEEALHGYMATDATMFPQAIALASSFDAGLMRDVSSVIAREVRARGVHLALSPVVDIVRDPRWGRIEETFGEDPYLVSELGVAAVEGLQGSGETLAPGKVFATLKHMTGHGQPESGINVAPAQVAERTLRENFFPPFEEVVRRTRAGAVMPSYNEIDGVPSHVNKWLISDVLRGEWGFDGLVVSDYLAIDDLVRLHHVAPDMPSAAIRALEAGVDSDTPDGTGFRTLADSVRAGKVSEAAINTAVGRMLTLKFRAGLFEQPYADFARADAITGNAEARALALKAAHRSMVLLKNDGVLPLTVGAHKKVALIGPNAGIARLGGYSSFPRQSITPLDGIKAKLGNKAELLYAQGAHITQSEDRSADEVLLADPAKNRQLIAEAVAVARQADIILLAIGDTEQTSREGFARTHLGDRARLDLVGEQNELFDALHALGKPVVVLAINGRPPSWPNVAAKAHAILECWYPGQEGGTAIADIVFGDVNPGGKLPVTVPRHEGQIPLFYNAKPSAGRGYLFESTDPLFPFGHGLSYTRFEIGAPRLSASSIGRDGSVEVSVEVTNTGKRAGDEVVQLYVHDKVSSITRPIKELKGFRRVTLKPGERRTLTFRLDQKAFRMWNESMERVVEPGEFDIMVGPNSVDLKTATLTIA